MDMEEDLAVGDILGIPASLDDDDVTIPRGKGKAAPIVVPHYDDIQLDRDGLAILPVDFLRDKYGWKRKGETE